MKKLALLICIVFSLTSSCPPPESFGGRKIPSAEHLPMPVKHTLDGWINKNLSNYDFAIYHLQSSRLQSIYTLQLFISIDEDMFYRIEMEIKSNGQFIVEPVFHL